MPQPSSGPENPRNDLLPLTPIIGHEVAPTVRLMGGCPLFRFWALVENYGARLALSICRCFIAIEAQYVKQSPDTGSKGDRQEQKPDFMTRLLWHCRNERHSVASERTVDFLPQYAAATWRAAVARTMDVFNDRPISQKVNDLPSLL